MTAETIINNFVINAEVEDIIPFGDGHINSTFKVITRDEEQPNYLLQKINQNVFKDVSQLTENMLRITKHIRHKISVKYPEQHQDTATLRLIETKDGEGFYIDEQNDAWRLFVLIERVQSINLLQNEKQAYQLGHAFGDFHTMLLDLPEPPLHEVIPGFHHTPKYIQQLKKSVEINSHNRLEEVHHIVDFLLSFEDEMHKIVKMGNRGELPLRIVHQDAKLNNILFDLEGNVVCIIDLDTTMPGYLCYDFGDAVRAGMNTAEEDEEDASKASLQFHLFQSFVKGYKQAIQDVITPTEIDTLAFGVKLLAYEQTVRFLTDHLQGDVYFKAHKKNHNLIRANVQLAFFKDVLSRFTDMDNYVKKVFSITN